MLVKELPYTLQVIIPTANQWPAGKAAGPPPPRIPSDPQVSTRCTFHAISMNPWCQIQVWFHMISLRNPPISNKVMFPSFLPIFCIMEAVPQSLHVSMDESWYKHDIIQTLAHFYMNKSDFQYIHIHISKSIPRKLWKRPSSAPFFHFQTLCFSLSTCFRPSCQFLPELLGIIPGIGWSVRNANFSC